MIKVFQKILLLLAVITVTAHSIFPHMHLDDIMAFAKDLHHEQPADTHHHHDTDNSNDKQHGLFSFAQLDDNFIPVNGQVKSFEVPIVYLPVIITIITDNFSARSKTHYSWYKEYPPPDDFCYITSLRGPPFA